MIATESFKRFRIRDFSIIIFCAIIYFLCSFFINKTFTPQTSYIFSLILLFSFMSFIVFLLNKSGSAVFFFIFCTILTYRIDELGTTGLNKLIVLLFAGIFFEILFLILKLEIKNIQLDVIFSAAFTSATIPIITAFIFSFSRAISLYSLLLNMIILAFFAGLTGSVVAFLAWFYIKDKKFFEGFEHKF